MNRVRLLGLYRSENGIWRYELERDGEIRWSSLHTRSEAKAQEMYETLKAMLESENGKAEGE